MTQLDGYRRSVLTAAKTNLRRAAKQWNDADIEDYNEADDRLFDAACSFAAAFNAYKESSK